MHARIAYNEAWMTELNAAFRSMKAMCKWRPLRNSWVFSIMRRRADIWSIIERFGMKPACCGRLQLWIAGSEQPSRSLVKTFARNGEKGYTSMIAADKVVTFSLPEWQYDFTCPVLGDIFWVPDLVDDVRQPLNDIIATGFKHFRRNLADAQGLVIFQQLHSIFYLMHSYWMGGALQRWLSGVWRVL